MKGIKDIGQYKRMTASGAIVPVGGSLMRFICTTTGTLQVTEGVTAGGADIVSSMPVTAGQIYGFGIDCPVGAWAVMGGGAIGTFVA